MTEQTLVGLSSGAAFVGSVLLFLCLSAVSSLTCKSLLMEWGMDAKARIEWNSRVVSMWHCVAALYTGWRCCFIDDGEAYSSASKAAFSSTPFRNTSLMLTCGYLFYDLCLVKYHSDIFPGTSTIFHHAVIICAFSLGVYFEIGFDFTFMIFLFFLGVT